MTQEYELPAKRQQTTPNPDVPFLPVEVWSECVLPFFSRPKEIANFISFATILDMNNIRRGGASEMLSDIKTRKIEEIKAFLEAKIFPISEGRWIEIFLRSGDLAPQLFEDQVIYPQIPQYCLLKYILSPKAQILYKNGFTLEQFLRENSQIECLSARDIQYLTTLGFTHEQLVQVCTTLNEHDSNKKIQILVRKAADLMNVGFTVEQLVKCSIGSSSSYIEALVLNAESFVGLGITIEGLAGLTYWEIMFLNENVSELGRVGVYRGMLIDLGFTADQVIACEPLKIITLAQNAEVLIELEFTVDQVIACQPLQIIALGKHAKELIELGFTVDQLLGMNEHKLYILSSDNDDYMLCGKDFLAMGFVTDDLAGFDVGRIVTLSSHIGNIQKSFGYTREQIDQFDNDKLAMLGGDCTEWLLKSGFTPEMLIGLNYTTLDNIVMYWDAIKILGCTKEQMIEFAQMETLCGQKAMLSCLGFTEDQLGGCDNEVINILWGRQGAQKLIDLGYTPEQIVGFDYNTILILEANGRRLLNLGCTLEELANYNFLSAKNIRKFVFQLSDSALRETHDLVKSAYVNHAIDQAPALDAVVVDDDMGVFLAAADNLFDAV